MNSDNESYQSKGEFFHPEEENILHDKENYFVVQHWEKFSILLKIDFREIFEILLNLIFSTVSSTIETEGIEWVKATLNALVSSEKECPFDHSFFFFDGRNTKFRHATSANKQTDVDDGAVITALNNSGSFQKHFVKCKKKTWKRCSPSQVGPHWKKNCALCFEYYGVRWYLRPRAQSVSQNGRPAGE